MTELTPTRAAPAWHRLARAPSLVRFAAVGAVNTGVSFLVFQAVFRGLSPRPGAVASAQALSYGAGMVVGYVAHRRVTFRSRGVHARQAPRFVAVNALMLASTTVVLEFLVARVGLRPALGWCAVTAAATLVNFQLQRRVVFAAGATR